MTPYVVNDEDGPDAASAAQKPKSIMMPSSANEIGINSDSDAAPKTNGDLVDTPDSLPSRSSVSGKSIIGNGKNGKSGALKRVSFGSSKGSMVETLVYDHQDDLSELPPFATPPLLNGEDSRLHPSKVRVKFFESQQVTQVACAPPSPDVTLDFASDSMASPVSDQSAAAAYARQTSAESGVDNPFRPDGELSREADTIVSLIKEGKPITPVKGEEDQDLKMMDGDPVVHNGLHTTTTPVDQTDSVVTASRDSPSKQEVIPAPTTAKPLEKSNGTTPNAAAAPAVVEVQHRVIAPPSDTPQVEQVTIKKKPKCKCCVIQ